MLEEGIGEHRHKRMAMKALPGSTLEVIKTELFFELLMRLFTDPALLDGLCQRAQTGLCRQVGEIVFRFTRGPAFADQPDLLPRQMPQDLIPPP